jgi:hypothetical protein
MCPHASLLPCSLASPGTRLSRAPSTLKGSDFHRGGCLLRAGPCSQPTRLPSRPRGLSQVPLTLPSPRVPCPETPPDSPAALACRGCLLLAFHVCERVGFRAFLTRLVGLHRRYGPRVALSTLHPCRCLHELKTRFPVGWRGPCRGGNDTRWKRRAWPGAPKQPWISAATR